MQRAIWNACGRLGEGAGAPAHTAAIPAAVMSALSVRVSDGTLYPHADEPCDCLLRRAERDGPRE